MQCTVVVDTGLSNFSSKRSRNSLSNGAYLCDESIKRIVTAGEAVLVAFASLDVTLSANLLRRASTSKSKLLKKSLPIIVCATSAIVNGQANSRPNPRLTFSTLVPYVRIGVPFAANKNLPVGVAPAPLGGMTQQSAPVSIR